MPSNKLLRNFQINREPSLGWLRSFHRNEWQRQNLHNRNIDSNANSIQTSTSPWRRFLLSQRPKILHGIFFYQASTVERLMKAIVEVWGASWDTARKSGLKGGWIISAGVVQYVPWSAPNFDYGSHQSYHSWGLVKKYSMQNFGPLR